jgi:DNA-binding transcriptional ArsR family regulator
MSIDIDSPAIVLRAMSDPTRWEILRMLHTEQLCACHLVEELGLSQPLVSHHLKVLRYAGLIEGERSSYWTYYRLVPEALRRAGDQLLQLATAPPSGDAARRPCC